MITSSIMFIFSVFLFLVGSVHIALSYPEEGKWHYVFNRKTTSVAVPKSLFRGSQIFITITCKADSPESMVDISWQVTESICYIDYPASLGNENDGIFYTTSPINHPPAVGNRTKEYCNGGHIRLKEYTTSQFKTSSTSPEKPNEPSRTKRDDESVKQGSHPQDTTSKPIFTITKDGLYTLLLTITSSSSSSEFSADVMIEMQGKHGYLSAADWPLLPFYGAMCIAYVLFGLAWLLVSFCQWRELLRIQFWIGGVILLGMLEKATFYAVYQNINSTGVSVKGAVLAAEWVSCGKRTLARMLVIIVSLGFGIVKPRLGPMLHRVVGIGACYFILAVVESYIRVMPTDHSPSNQLLIASIPLAVLDSAICWWIFTSLVQTTRTLRLRRNMVKLNLYRHFTNTLIFAVVASVIFMLYSIKAHRLAECLTDWKELWVDEAYWHVLFSVLLLVIMILWRPTNNNQRYAFTPLLDAADDDEEEDQFVNDAYGVKMRTHSRANSPKPKSSTDDDILKWVDENIPSAGVETALPILDSEEEILTTKFEVSKMQ